MRKLIHHLRRQPEEVRRHVLHIVIFVVAIIMITLWIFSLGKSLADPDTKLKMKQDLKPFSVLKDGIIDGYKSTGDSEISPTE